MDSCPLAAITEARPGDLSKDGNEMEVTSLEEAKSVIAALRARQRAQAHQMLAWRRTLKLQVKTKLRGSREYVVCAFTSEPCPCSLIKAIIR